MPSRKNAWRLGLTSCRCRARWAAAFANWLEVSFEGYAASRALARFRRTRFQIRFPMSFVSMCLYLSASIVFIVLFVLHFLVLVIVLVLVVVLLDCPRRHRRRRRRCHPNRPSHHSASTVVSASAASLTFRSCRPCGKPTKSATRIFRAEFVSSSRMFNFQSCDDLRCETVPGSTAC